MTCGRVTPGIGGHVGGGVETHLDAAFAHLPHEPVGDGRIILALRRARGDQDLAAEGRRGLQQGDAMAPQRRDPRRLEAAHAAADHQHALGSPRGGDHPQLLLPADHRVLDTGDRLALAQAADAALARAHARADVVEASFHGLLGHLGVGDHGARHADEVAHAGGEHPLRLLRRAHAAGEDHGHLHHRARGGGEIGVQRMRVVEGGRDHRFEAKRLRVRPAHHPVVRDAEGVGPPRDLEQVLLGQPAGDEVVAAVPHPDDEVVSDGLAHRPEHLVGESHPVVDAAAVFVGARVGERGEKVLEQMTAVEGNVAAVVAALLEPHRRRRPRIDDLADLGLGHHVGPLAMAFFTSVGRTPQRGPRVPGVAAPTPVGDLRQAEGAVPVHRRAHLLELRDDAVVPVVDLGPVVDRGGMNARGAEHHHHPAAALGLLLVVAEVAVGEAAPLAVGGAVGGGDDAVLGGRVAERDGAQEVTERGRHGYLSLAS